MFVFSENSMLYLIRLVNEGNLMLSLEAELDVRSAEISSLTISTTFNYLYFIDENKAFNRVRINV